MQTYSNAEYIPLTNKDPSDPSNLDQSSDPSAACKDHNFGWGLIAQILAGLLIWGSIAMAMV
jgi:hypothetical protein